MRFSSHDITSLKIFYIQKYIQKHCTYIYSFICQYAFRDIAGKMSFFFDMSQSCLICRSFQIVNRVLKGNFWSKLTILISLGIGHQLTDYLAVFDRFVRFKTIRSISVILQIEKYKNEIHSAFLTHGCM